MVVSTDADSGGVWVMGSFTSPSWQSGAIKLNDDGNGVYSATAFIGGAPEVEFKFVNGKPNTALAVEESGDFESMGCGIANPVSTPNRLFNRTDADTTLAFCWNLCTATCDSANSVSEIPFQSDVNVYPNPFTDITTVSFSEAGNYNLVVVDLTGKVVLATVNAGASKVSLNLSALNNGMYILKIVDANGATTTKKLVLQ